MNQLPFVKTIKSFPSAAFALVFLLIILSFFSDFFWTAENFINLGTQASVLAMISLGMTLIILTEGIDLSPGALMGLCGVVIAVYLHKGMEIFAVAPLSVGIGIAVGIVNGVLIGKFKLPPFVVTLGTGGMCEGLALVIAEGSSISGFSESFRFIAYGSIFNIPFPVIVLVFLVLFTYLLLDHTRFGTYIYSIGGNEEAVKLSGVNVVIYKILVYGIAGGFAGIGALVMTSRMTAAHPTAAIGYEFEAIVAVVLGGTSFILGKGNIFGSLIGAATIALLRNGMNLLGVPTAMQLACVGVFLMLAIIYDSIKGV